MSLVEVIVLKQEDAQAAESNGADRLELVSAMSEGGLTPSYGTIKTVVKSVTIPVMVMIRPHSYSFVYRKKEWDAMKEDIKMVKELGAAGIVFGALTDHKTVDNELLAMVVEEAKGLSVTFHRAIDETDPLETYKSLCQSPFKMDRILTSGGKRSAPEALDTIQKMIAVSQETQSHPIIIPGAGLNLDNIEFIHKKLRAKEYHFGSAVRIDGDFNNRICGDAIQRIKSLVG